MRTGCAVSDMALPHGWRWADRDGDVEFARDLIRQTMTPYWRRRGMVFNTTLFMRQWVKLNAAIIECDGSAAGVVAWENIREVAYLRELHLIEAFRGNGLGTRILHDWMAMQRAQGARTMRLKVFADNPARHLYERVGFLHTKSYDDIEGLLGMQYEAA